MKQILYSILTVALLWVTSPNAGFAEDAQQSLSGVYTFDAAESQNPNTAIDASVAEMNFLIRGLAKSRLLKTNKPSKQITIHFSGPQVTVQYDDRPPLTTPTNGVPIQWNPENNASIEVTTEVAQGALNQTFKTSEGQRANHYVLSKDNKTLYLNVLISSPWLKSPIQYQLSYKRS